MQDTKFIVLKAFRFQYAPTALNVIVLQYDASASSIHHYEYTSRILDRISTLNILYFKRTPLSGVS